MVRDVEKLAAVLADLAEKNVLAAEDMKRGNERLKAMQNAQKALQETRGPQLQQFGCLAQRHGNGGGGEAPRGYARGSRAKAPGVGSRLRIGGCLAGRDGGAHEELDVTRRPRAGEMKASTGAWGTSDLYEPDQNERFAPWSFRKREVTRKLVHAFTYPDGFGSWKVTESGASGADSWPQAAEVPQAGYAPAAPTRASGASSSLGVDKAAPGLRRFIAELSTQLAEEVKRREVEEEERTCSGCGSSCARWKELDMVKKQKEKLEIEQRADEAAAAEIEQQHSKLAEEHRALRQEVAKQEEELEQLRAEAKARTGQGRDWARDGPEKDALVETKLRIAEAHEDLAQLRQQLWLNREGLKRQLAELQAENMRLRTGRSPLA
eukprot:g7099.t1